MELKLFNQDNIELLKTLPDNSIDSIVTDPPYGISFMGKKWDYDVPSVETWKECMRVLKSGGHILVACGTRTQHRMAVNIEDAGFEIRDIVAWIYGSGFPKSLNIGKVADKYLKTGNASWNGTGDSSNGALGYSKLQHQLGYRPEDYSNKHQNKNEITEGDAKRWEGWGTALKPAMELWTLARKPLSEKNVASNVLKWGTGGINIDGSRVGMDLMIEGRAKQKGSDVWNNENRTGGKGSGFKNIPVENPQQHIGRFPANVIHDGSDEVTDLFPNSKSTAQPRNNKNKGKNYNCFNEYNDYVSLGYDDSGSASRFFYCAKASKSERNAGLDGFVEKENAGSYQFRTDGSLDGKPTNPKANFHPTVKPVALMRYLVKMITPIGGMVLDPFMGSGSTGVACMKENFSFTGIELDPEYFKIAEARINNQLE